MSVQLIVYPQDLLETTITSTSTTAAGQEFLYDGQIFSTLNIASKLEMDDVYPHGAFDAILNGKVLGNGTVLSVGQYPTTPNTWYNCINEVFSVPALDFPTQVGSNVEFATERHVTTYDYGIIYQRLTGLTSGETYRVTINNTIDAADESFNIIGIVPTNFTGDISAWTHFNMTHIGTGVTGVYDGTPVVYDFVASDTSMIFFFGLVTTFSTRKENLKISSISIMSMGATSTSTGTTTITEGDLLGQEILDLYEEETIPLTLSVDNFKDVATKTQSYSKAFQLPATKKNNKVFGSIYEVTKKAETGEFGFNPYISTLVTLKENGFIVFEGFLRLIDIIDRDGEISYNVNLYSETVALMDVLKDKTLNDLTFQ